MKDKRIISYLLNAGIKPSLTGFTYLYDAIEITISNNNMVKSVMNLYKDVASKYGVNFYNVERQIRYAIKNCDKYKEFNVSEFISRSALEISLSE